MYSAHREMAKRRGPGGLMRSFGLTEEEADLIWDMDFGGGHESWMRSEGMGMEDVVRVYNSASLKMHRKWPGGELGYAYIGGGEVHFSDR